MKEWLQSSASGRSRLWRRLMALFFLQGLWLLTACQLQQNIGRLPFGDEIDLLDPGGEATADSGTASPPPPSTIAPSDLPAPSPSPTLPPNFSFSHVSFSYDEAVVGRVSAEKLPAHVTALDGSPMYLHDVPDFIQVTFDREADARQSKLVIQPIRNTKGDYFRALPHCHVEHLQALEMALQADTSTSVGGNQQVQVFQSGKGRRAVTNTPDTFLLVDSAEDFFYVFEGITADGFYYVKLTMALDAEASEPEQSAEGEKPPARVSNAITVETFDPDLSAIDAMVYSLEIGREASTEASVPTNPPGCVNDSELVERTASEPLRIDAGEVFTTTWRIRNSGTCIWTSDIALEAVTRDGMVEQTSAEIPITYPDDETEVTLVLQAPEKAGSYIADWRLRSADGGPFGALVTVAIEVPEPPDTIDGYGEVQGRITYPSGTPPAMTIYFLRTDGSERYNLDTAPGWTRYSNDLPVGEYVVFAVVPSSSGNNAGGYTQFVTCGETSHCTDHALETVVVREHRVSRHIDIGDWYAPPGTFPSLEETNSED